MRLAQLHQEILRKFSQAGIEEARSDTDQLLGYCLGLSRSQLVLQASRELNDRELAHCRKLTGRRLARVPLQYITGTREFWSLEFVVSPAVLIPRPETEFLVEQVLRSLDRSGYRGGPILDMCTGSGVIAVVLARELGAEVIAVDNSPQALDIAAINIRKYGKEWEISLVGSDLFSALNRHRRFELIVSNPPYVKEGDLAGLQPEVALWEPAGALAAGKEGLDVIKRLAEEAPGYLLPGGWLFMEIGSDQGDAALAVFRHCGCNFDCLDIINDWSGRPRVLKARKKKDPDGQTDY